MFARSDFLEISPVSRDCWSKYANTGPSSFTSAFRTLGWSSLGLKAFEGFKHLSILITHSEDTKILSMKGADLLVNGMSLYSVLLNASLTWPISSSALSESDSATPFPPLFLRGRLPCLFLTIYLSVEVSMICLCITYQVCHLQIMLLFNVSLYFPSQGPVASACILFLQQIFLLISGVSQGIVETDLLIFEKICLSAESWMNEVIKLKCSCTDLASDWHLEYFSFANLNASFLIVSKSPFWYYYNFLRGFFICWMKILKNPETMSWSLSLSGEWIS